MNITYFFNYFLKLCLYVSSDRIKTLLDMGAIYAICAWVGVEDIFVDCFSFKFF